MNTDRIQKKIEEMKKKKDARKKDFWFPKPGNNEIRVLPHWSGDMEADFYYETSYHKNLGPSNDKSLVCPIAEGLEECPVCNTVKELYRTKDAEDKVFAKSIRAQTRIYWNIVDLKEKDKGVQVWMTGGDILEQVLEFCANSKYGDVTDPIKGRNITLIFTEAKNTKSGYNEYAVQPDPDRTSVDSPEWLEQLSDLKSFVKLTPIEEMEAILWGKEIVQKGYDKSVRQGVEFVQKEVVQKEESQEKPPDKQPDKPCKGKYSPEDYECTPEKCLQSKECEELRKVGKAAKTVESAVVPQEARQAKTEVADPSKESKINSLLQKIRDQQVKK